MSFQGIPPSKPAPLHKEPFVLANLYQGYTTNGANMLSSQEADLALNVIYEGGEIICRPGQEYLFPVNLGVGKINGLGYFQKADKTIVRLIHFGTKLYEQTLNNAPVEIYSGLQDKESCFFSFNGKFHLINGTDFINYDGVTVKKVADQAYIPTLTQGRSPSGSTSEAKQDPNYLSDSCYDCFSADGAATTYQLSKTGLTSIDQVTFGNLAGPTGPDLVAGVDYYAPTAADLLNGQIRLIAGNKFPAGTNNIYVKWTKAGMMDKTKITGNTKAIVYEDRIWLLNEDSGTIFFSGLTGEFSNDGTYFAEDDWRMSWNLQYQVDNCKGWAIHNNTLLLLKEHSIEGCTAVNNGAEFSWSIISPNTGCDAPKSIQLINNDVVFLNSKKGVCIIRSLLNKDERNVDIISARVNGSRQKPGILDEQLTDLRNAASVDTGRLYILTIGQNTFVWDYGKTPYAGNPAALAWWLWQGLTPQQYVTIDNEIYYGDRTNGKVIHLTAGKYNDFGEGIKQIYRTGVPPEFNKYARWLKKVNEIGIVVTPNANSEQQVIFYLDDETTDPEIINAQDTGSFSFDTAAFDNWTFQVNQNDQLIGLLPGISNTRSLRMEISCEAVNNSISIIAILGVMILSKEIKY